MLEQAKKTVLSVVMYWYTCIRACDGPTGQMASASPAPCALLNSGAPAREASGDTIVTLRDMSAFLCRRQDIFGDSTA